ncbi:MAG: O-methyltransferase [Candidatus Hodarchaeota archaeon]
MLSNEVEAVLSKLEKHRMLEIVKEQKNDKIPKEKRSLAITREEGKFLYILVKLIQAKRIVEIGTSFGYSTIWLAAAMKDANIDGKIISFDVLPEKIKKAQFNLNSAGLADYVDLVQGDAMEFIQNSTESFDMVFLDADKEDYPLFFKMCLPKLPLGGVILSDNVIDCPEIHKDNPEICEEYLQFVQNHPKCSTVTLPFMPNGLELTIKNKD